MFTRNRTVLLVLTVWAILGSAARSHSQAALLMEEPYGFFGTLNPTGHTAIYFARICAETPVKLRACEPGEPGSVIARYQGIAGYDWVAMPLIPYLYSVEDPADVPQRVNHATVLQLRTAYHDQHLTGLGSEVFEGSFVHGGWNQLVGVAYERRIYAFRFATTEEQDEALMEQLNDSRNRTQFNLLYNNCADFARKFMNQYFPHTFNRTLFPDMAMTTPRQLTFKLVRYAKKHPEMELTIFEIPQVPGYRRPSHANQSVAASLIMTGYAIPIALLNPYLAGGIFVDYLVRGRFPRRYAHPAVLQPDQIAELTGDPQPRPTVATGSVKPIPSTRGAQSSTSAILNTGMKETFDSHE
ncbi:MAG TPA: hypothetical protein VGL22_08060 [Terracidiphilus sp.]|jgi:hypothetical protein